MKRKPILIVALTLILLAVAAIGVADYTNPDPPSFVPMTVPYQGVIERDGGLVSGTASFELSLWSAESGGSLIWGPETHADVPLNDGRFSVVIGSVEALSYSDIENKPVYLAIEVQVDDVDSAMVPLAGRQQLHSSPYAIRAYRAEYAFHAAEAEQVLSLSKLHQNTRGVGVDVVDPQNTLDLKTRSGQTADGLALDGRAAVTSGASDAQLHFNPTGAFTGGSIVHGELEVTGDVDVTGTVSANIVDVGTSFYLPISNQQPSCGSAQAGLALFIQVDISAGPLRIRRYSPCFCSYTGDSDNNGAWRWECLGTPAVI